MKHKHAVNQKEHKHADLLRMAADNEEQLFECDSYPKGENIYFVLAYPEGNWQPVKQTKKIKRWLWATNDGLVTSSMYSEKEIVELDGDYPIKLLWSETEFEVSHD